MSCPKCDGDMNLKKMDYSRLYIFRFHACRVCNLLVASIEHRKKKDDEEGEE
jgi:predicted  nucleic acid-binding Zn ribbon protein